MPIRTISEVDPNALKAANEQFLIFFSSIVDDKLWCPDCAAVDSVLKAIFGPKDAPSVLVVYVGDRSTWKSLANPYRGDPWSVSSIPTIIKVKEGKEVGRLVDTEITEAGLDKFIA